MASKKAKNERPRKKHAKFGGHFRRHSLVSPIELQPSDDIFDPARQILISAEEAKKKRKQEETLVALEKIQGRIGYTLKEYEGKHKSKDSEELKNVDFDSVEDLDQLHEMLTDPKLRSKYYQRLTAFIMDYETKCEKMENTLVLLQDFFIEMQSGGTQKLLEQVSNEEIDLEEATAALEGALTTAKTSVNKLLEINKGIGQLMSIVTAYPDTSKGRKKMEKALMKAQEEAAAFSLNLGEMQKKIENSTARCTQLEAQLDNKTQECTKLRTAADELKKLQVTNKELSKQLATVQKELKESQKDQDLVRRSQATSNLDLPPPGDKEKMNQLESELQNERSKSQDLVSQMEKLATDHKSEMEALTAEHEAESAEVKGRLEEQLKSLMEEGDEFEAAAQEDEEDTVTFTTEQTKDTKEELENDSSQEYNIRKTSTPASSRVSLDHEEQLRKQHSEKEKTQSAELKAKYSKMIAIVQKQLANATHKGAEEEKKFRDRLETIGSELSLTQLQKDELREKLKSMEVEKDTLLSRLERSEKDLEGKEEELEKMREQILKSRMQSPDLFQLPLSSTLLQSESILPLVAMEEVLTIDEPDVFPSFLDQSATSMDPAPLGSPLESSSFHEEALQQSIQYNLSMLAGGSRLSHYSSSAPQGAAVTHGHPVVVEWVKAYDSVIKFKNGVISLLVEHLDSIPPLSPLIDEMKSMEVYSMNKKQDVQGQITEMRFNLVLLLHQTEQTLRESFTQMMSWKQSTLPVSIPIPDSGSQIDPQLAELKASVSWFKQKLDHTEKQHKSEIDNYEDHITNLSTKIEGLEIELAKLRKAMSTISGNGTVLFTHLDSERNSRALKVAIEKERLSKQEFNSLMQDMEEYLTIPSQRLVSLAHRLQEKYAVAKLVQNIHKVCLDPKQAAAVLERIVKMEETRQSKYSSNMEKFGALRKQLACTLTHNLSKVEKQTGMYLIKPVFGDSTRQSHDIITPIRRPLPINQHYTPERTISRVSYSDKTSSAFDRSPTRTSTLPRNISRTITASPSSQLRNTPPTSPRSHRRASTAQTQLSAYQRKLLSRQPLTTCHVATHTPVPVTQDTEWYIHNSHPDKYDHPTRISRYTVPKAVEMDMVRSLASQSPLGQVSLRLNYPKNDPPASGHSPTKLVSLLEESSSFTLQATQASDDSKMQSNCLPTVHLPTHNTITVT